MIRLVAYTLPLELDLAILHSYDILPVSHSSLYFTILAFRVDKNSGSRDNSRTLLVQPPWVKSVSSTCSHTFIYYLDIVAFKLYIWIHKPKCHKMLALLYLVTDEFSS